MEVVHTVKYLVRQGLAFGGHTEAEKNQQQLSLMQVESDPELEQWLQLSTIRPSAQLPFHVASVAHPLQTEL